MFCFKSPHASSLLASPARRRGVSHTRSFAQCLFILGLLLIASMRAHAIVPPINLTAVGGSAQVSLSWTAVPGSGPTYKISRALTSGGPYALVVFTAAGATSFTDIGLAGSTKYFYVVSSSQPQQGGPPLQSSNSNEATATTLVSPPTGLTAAGGSGQISLSWAASIGAASYNVKRSSANGGPYATIGSTAALSLIDTNLPPSTIFFYVVTGVNAGGESPNSSSVSATTGIGSPTGLGASALGTQITLNWTAVPGTTAYNVYRSTTNGGPYALVTTAGSVPTFTNTGLNTGTVYYYVVRSFIPPGTESGNSNQATAVTIPPNPTSLISTPGTGQVALSWSAAAGATTYNVKRSTTTGGPYTTVASPLTTSFTNIGLAPGTAYFYVVSAVNGAGESSNSNQTSSITTPPIPIGLTAVSAPALITLTWTASQNATGYNVKRSTTSGGPYTTVSSPALPLYINIGLNPGATYFYVVSAVNLGGESGNSSEATSTIVPLAPLGVSAVSASARISLSWSAASGASSYNVKRATITGGPYATVASVTGTSSTDIGLSPGTTYYYVISGVNAGGEGPNSSEMNAITMPPPPTGLAATPSTGQITLAWIGSLGATSYNVKRSGTTGGPYTTIASPLTTAFMDTGLSAGTTYFYIVTSVNAGGESGTSNEASAITAPPAPTSLTATGGSAQITLVWIGSLGAASYNVKRSGTTGGPYTVISSPTSPSYTNAGLSAGTTYFYIVTSVNAGGESANSNEASAITTPPTPTGLTATSAGTQVSLSWTASLGAASYNVKRSTVTGGPYTTVSSPTTANYLDLGLANGGTYYYVVSAVNTGGESANSNEASTSTVPSAPTGLTATGGAGQVSLTWIAVPGATGYNVKHGTLPGGPYTTAATVAGTSYTDTSLANGTTYYYVVSALNPGGESANSVEASAITTPTAPTGLTATGGTAQIALAWTGSLGAASYNVKRSATTGGPYTTIASPAATSFIDTGLSAGTTYFYIVTSVNAGGESANSTEASAITAAAAPTGLTATGGTGQITLAWTGSIGAASYNVKRSATTGGPYTIISSPTSTSYTNTGLIAGTTYYYVVSALNPGGESASSNEASAITAAAAPTGLTATGGTGQITLAWTGSIGASSYNVKRSATTGGPYTVISSPTSTSYTNAGLIAGTTYYYVVTGVNAGGESANSTEASAITTPPTPIGLTATSAGTQVSLSWTASLGAASYIVKRSTVTGGPYTTVSSPTTANYIDLGLTNGSTYYYAVSAVNTGGESANSNEASTSTVPSAPTGLAATGGAGQVSLTWAAVPGATGYNVKHGTLPGGPYTTAATVAGTSYTDTSLAPGTTYYYVVSALNPGGESANSVETSAITAAAAPTGLTATGGTGQITLAWIGSVGAPSYNIKRSATTGGPYTTIASPAVAAFTDTGLSAGTTYFYIVTSVNTGGESGTSNEASAITASPAPTGLTATGGTGQITLAWTGSIGASSYNVKRSATTGGPYTVISSPTSPSYTNTGLIAGTTYYYVVTAVNTGGESANSTEASAITAPSAPVGLTAAAGDAQIAVSWNSSLGAVNYNVKRSTVTGGPYTTVSNTLTTSYNDAGLTNGTTYYYVVSAVNGGGGSSNSNEASATPQPAITAAPTGLTAIGGTGQIDLTWIAVTGATSYNIKHSTLPGGPYTTAGTTTLTSYTDTSLAPGLSYYYVVSAVNGGGESANSSEASAITAPATPIGLTAAGGTTQVSLAWSAATGATSYNVKRSTTNGGPYTAVSSPTGTSVIDTGLSAGTTYYYVVSAVNTGGESANSSQASAATITAVPSAPTGLAATGGTGQVALTWIGSSGATSYNIKRGTISGGPYATVSSSTVAGYTDIGLAAGTTYYYVVSAVNTGGESANSSQASAVTTPAIPAAPTGLAATGGTGQITLTWNASTGATSYNIKRGLTFDGAFTTVSSTASTSFIDTGLIAGTTYFYMVSAVNAGGESANSGQASATTTPPIPTGLSATGGSIPISVTWNASLGATGYNLKRSTTSGGPYSTISSPAAPSYMDTSVSIGATYYYVVSAVNTGGQSGNSGQASATLLPAPPTGLAAVAGNAQVSLTWSASTGATSYNVKRSTINGGPYATVSSPTGASFIDTGLTNGVTYYYVATALNAGGESANSSQVSGTPQALSLQPPANFTATGGTRRVVLTWTASLGATSYKLERSADGNTPWTLIASPTGSPYSDTGLAAGTTYFYRMRATNAGGDSNVTATVSATTVPAGPQGMVAIPGNGQIALSWTAALGATSYEVKRSTTSGGSYNNIGNTSTTSFTDTGLTNLVTYYYIVEASNASGEGGESTEVSATPRTMLALTTAGVSLGFQLTTFVTGYPFDSNTNPHGIVFTDTGGVLVSEYAGNLKLFPTDTDNQNQNNVSVAQNTGTSNAKDLAKIGASVYMTESSLNGGQVVQINQDGTPTISMPNNNTVIAGTQVGTAAIPHALGICARPDTDTSGHHHLFVTSSTNPNNDTNSGSIWDIDPIKKTAAIWLPSAGPINLPHPDSMAISSDGSVLYVAFQDSSPENIVGYNTATKAVVFDYINGIFPGRVAAVPIGAVDGIALGTGSLAGKLITNGNDGSVYLIDLTLGTSTAIAAGGSRGDFVTADPSGGYLLTQTDRILRLIGPP